MFKVKNEDIKTTLFTSFSCLYGQFWTYLIPFFSVSFAALNKYPELFKQLNPIFFIVLRLLELPQILSVASVINSPNILMMVLNPFGQT